MKRLEKAYNGIPRSFFIQCRVSAHHPTAPPLEDVGKIKAPLLIHHAGKDERIKHVSAWRILYNSHT